MGGPPAGGAQVAQRLSSPIPPLFETCQPGHPSTDGPVRLAWTGLGQNPAGRVLRGTTRDKGTPPARAARKTAGLGNQSAGLPNGKVNTPSLEEGVFFFLSFRFA